MGKRKTYRKSPINGPQKPVDRVSARLMRNSRRVKGETVVPDGVGALQNAIDWALKGIEDTNSELCLCPRLRTIIREFLNARKERMYMSESAKQELEADFLKSIESARPSSSKRTIRGKEVTYWSASKN